ncbi:MAG: hypothetical protein AB7Q23_04150 [Hyphomonadaceae bacterium]
MPKWVDNEFYFGPDRRRRDAGKRWGDRRQLNDAADPPPLGAVLRRMRVQLMDLSTAEDRRKVMQLGSLAITEAEQRRDLVCADLIRNALRFIAENQIAQADGCIAEALAIASGDHAGYR